MEARLDRWKAWRILAAAAAWCFPSAVAEAGKPPVCADCHPKVWETYRNTGMGRSFYRPTPETMIEDFVRKNTYYHEPSRSYFTMLIRDGQYFQRRHQLDSSGRQINVMEKRIDYVLGSGNHARAYLHRTAADTLIELPLGWYAEKGGYWAMNPGYDRPDHEGFRRPITYDCMFCHNAYPRIPAGHERPFAPSIYAGPLPEGIDCQRCHGPGDKHVEQARTAGASREAIRAAIVNPARLSAERQMEICMACHLETTSFPLPNALLRYDRGPFSYRPGEPLSGFILNFDHAAGTGREDKFEIVNAAYRLRKSACFQKSKGKLLCTTCHNPHDVPRGEAADRHYEAVCRQCHAAAFEKLVAAGRHTREAACIDCHMPKRRTEDVVHVAATDHLIQRRKPEGDLLAERPERHETGANAYRGPVALYYPETLPPTPENELYLAVAQVKQGSNLSEGIGRLAALLEKHPAQRAEFHFELAEALMRTGQPDKAAPRYQQALKRDPRFAMALQRLGVALRRMHRQTESLEILKQAAAMTPGDPLTWHELGLTYRALERPADAAAAIEKALELDPELPEAHNNLGILRLAAGAVQRAEAAFREAIRIRPEYADAHGNLASLLSAARRFEEAEAEYEAALRLRPADAAARYNYAMLLGRTGRYDRAQRELEASLRADPEFADAHELLGDLLRGKGQTRDAARHYREALKIRPDSARAHLGLGAALAAAGELNAALPHLQKAAVSADAATRQQASEALRKIGKGLQ